MGGSNVIQDYHVRPYICMWLEMLLWWLHNSLLACSWNKYYALTCLSLLSSHQFLQYNYFHIVISYDR